MFHSGTDVKSTPTVQRDVNPMFNAVLVLDDVCAEDRLQFQIKDRGLISVDRLGGFVPPTWSDCADVVADALLSTRS